MKLRLTQNLSNLLDSGIASAKFSETDNLERFKSLPFYCEWTYGRKLSLQDCCCTHAIGLPKKNGQPMALFDYELDLYNALQEHKLIWLLKSTGLGITEFLIRYISWLCLKDDALKGSQIVIVTGPRLDLSISIIERMKHLFIDSDLLTFDTKATVIQLNGVHIQAYPSDHLDDARGIPNVSFFYADEADFFSPGEQNNLRDVAERYIAKSNPWIVLVSTPNAPGGLFETMQNEKASIYHRMYMDYTVGLNRIYDNEQIALQKLSPSFDREYCLKFLGGIGNVFPMQDIEACIQTYDLSPEVTTSTSFPRWIGIDPGYSPSQFGICVVQWNDDALSVVYTASLEKPLYTETLTLIRQLVQRYHACKVFIDGSASHLIHELKHGYGEYVTYENLPEKTLDIYIKSGCGEPLIVPVSFWKHHKTMLAHAMKILAKRKIRIDPSFDKLIVALKSATTKAEYDLDKSKSSNNDLLDAMQLSMLCLKPEGE
jgi:hypothetical protein